VARWNEVDSVVSRTVEWRIPAGAGECRSEWGADGCRLTVGKVVAVGVREHCHVPSRILGIANDAGSVGEFNFDTVAIPDCHGQK
jgi:hypothetical protein